MRKNILLTVLMVTALSFLSQGQTRPSADERLKARLSLSDEQFDKLKAASEKFRNDQMRISKDTSLTRGQLMKERERAVETRDREFKKILTEEQYDKWMTLKQAQSLQPGPRQQRGVNIEEMKKELGLTDAQAEKIQVINKEMAAKFEKLRADTSLTRESRVKAISLITAERNAKLKEVFTEEQYALFQEFEKRKMTQHRRGGRPRSVR